MNRRIKLPVMEKRPGHYPKKPLCPWCKKRKVWGPHSMAILCGGALGKIDRDTYAAPTKGLKGFLSLKWHGADDPSGEGEHRYKGVLLYLAEDIYGGYFYLMFCSVKCLRAFLNSCLDEFERRIEKAKPVY
ncbi:MAG: hypothetical protein HY706_16730 [Candidatus Hydrogenedentes bacterium]|nr:hypothetical protein [Candidatus Hydrogenedentota bacterium]